MDAERGAAPEGADIVDVLAGLYASEINVMVASFWDGGWTATLGDNMNGFGGTVSAPTLGELATKLTALAVATHPTSHFARRHRGEVVVGPWVEDTRRTACRAADSGAEAVAAEVERLRDHFELPRGLTASDVIDWTLAALADDEARAAAAEADVARLYNDKMGLFTAMLDVAIAVDADPMQGGAAVAKAVQAVVERLTRERDEARGWAEGWHRAVEVILTMAGLSPALGAVEAAPAMQAWMQERDRGLAAAEARAEAVEGELDAARDLLKRFEWNPVQRQCQICKQYQPGYWNIDPAEEGHKANCALAAQIGGTAREGWATCKDPLQVGADASTTPRDGGEHGR